MIFNDRLDAGAQLAQKLLSCKKRPNTIVLGLARGGVVVAYQVAKLLLLPLNVLVPRKIGAPGNPELALGAVAEDGELLLNEPMIALLGVSRSFIQEAAQRAQALSHERLSRYRRAAPLGDLKGKTVIVIDDGVATGATMLVEIHSLRKQGVHTIIAASPVASTEAWTQIQKACDQAVCLSLSDNFGGVSQFYLHFDQVEDEMVQSFIFQKGRPSL